MTQPLTRTLRLGALLATTVIAVAACGSSSSSGAKKTAGTPSSTTSTAPVDLRLGYFPNVTHGPALIGLESGLFQQKLGKNVTLKPQVFNAGPDVVTALYSDALDASFIGPGPSISAFQKSNGQAIRIVAGAASGGAFLVVKPSITKAADLKGKKIASPQLGNTQDIALRTWLKKQGFTTDTSGGGDVSVVPQDNAVTLTAFQQGQIDGAWVPEPWATRLVKEGGGKVLVDERDLWPQGKFVTTDLIVSTKFLDAHPDVVKQLLEGELAAIQLAKTNRTKAEGYVASGIQKATGKAIAPDLVTASFDSITFTVDPLASTLVKNAQESAALGLITSADVKGIYDLTILNQVLKAAGQPAVKGL
ncbi:MAG: ABC transporter substrate-binding protein [Acidimicrobiia bacterium]